MPARIRTGDLVEDKWESAETSRLFDDPEEREGGEDPAMTRRMLLGDERFSGTRMREGERRVGEDAWGL